MLSGRQAKICLPVTLPILERIHEHLSCATQLEWLTIWAIASTAFFGCFRLGELLPASVKVFDPSTHLAWGDVSIDSYTNPTIVQVHLKKLKCDQFGKGVRYSDWAHGKELLSCLGPPQVYRYAKAGPGKPITFTEKIQACLQALGLPQNDFAGHSFRISEATSAGLED